MTTYYTEKERKAALRHVRINPDEERVDSAQAARILSWRAREEYQVEHEYDATAVRKHTSKLDPRPAIKEDGSINARKNTYSVKKLFEIDILPARTNGRKKVASP